MFENSKRKLRVPAIGLFVIGGLGLIGQIFSAVLFLVQGPTRMREDMREAFEEIAREVPEFPLEAAERVADLGPIVQSIFLAVGALGSLVMLAGGWNMLRLKNYEVCFAACVIAMIPFCSPCCGCLPLCLPGAAIGIWGLIVLFDDEVRDAFRGIQPPGTGAPVVSSATAPWAPPASVPPPPQDRIPPPPPPPV
ncbi:MAG: hypothetical protein FJ299_00525 [Planctomycetes bacterium]|nr:hypothetical protein [Planctomycetota bacterium]